MLLQQTPAPDVTATAAEAAKKTAEGEVTSAIGQVTSLGEKAIDAVITYGPRVLGAMLVLFVAWMLAGWAQRAAARGLTKAHFDATLSKFLANTLRWLILGGALLACLSVFGVDTTSYAALIGAAGLAIGLGFQGSLSNLAAGVMLLIFRPFKVGDSIVVGGQAGVVDEIELFTTSMDTPDNRRIIIPNGQIFGSTVENTTYHERRRTDITVVVAPSADLDQTRAVLLDAAKRVQGALPDPVPNVVLTDLGASGGPNWRVEIWANAGELGAVRERALIAIKRALEQAKIAGPVPVMNVNMIGSGAR